MTYIDESSGKFICNHCASEYDKSPNYSYICTQCNFYICIKYINKYLGNYSYFNIRNEKNKIKVEERNKNSFYYTKYRIILYNGIYDSQICAHCQKDFNYNNEEYCYSSFKNNFLCIECLKSSSLYNLFLNY